MRDKMRLLRPALWPGFLAGAGALARESAFSFPGNCHGERSEEPAVSLALLIQQALRRGMSVALKLDHRAAQEKFTG